MFPPIHLRIFWLPLSKDTMFPIGSSSSESILTSHCTIPTRAIGTPRMLPLRQVSVMNSLPPMNTIIAPPKLPNFSSGNPIRLLRDPRKSFGEIQADPDN